MKGLFIKKVVEESANFLDNNQRIKLKEIVTEICLIYQIERIEQTEKQETLKNNADILNKFIASKEIVIYLTSFSIELYSSSLI